MKSALIVGSNGQDGQLLWRYLASAGYELAGIDKGMVCGSAAQHIAQVDIEDPASIARLIRLLSPDEIYHLAAYHHSAEEMLLDPGGQIRASLAVNTLSLVNLLDAVKAHAPASRVFYAASSHVFGDAASQVQDETTPFNPTSPYGISKAAGVYICRYYRAGHGLFCAAGILFNHESSLRSPQFISRKIVRAAVRIKQGVPEPLVVGNLDAVVDWGYAPDYVEAMWRILQLSVPEDFIVASGAVHSVREFAQTVFEILGLDWRCWVVEDPAIIRKLPSPTLQGHIGKIRRLTGWFPRTSFRGMVEEMIKCEFGHE